MHRLQRLVLPLVLAVVLSGCSQAVQSLMPAPAAPATPTPTSRAAAAAPTAKPVTKPAAGATTAKPAAAASPAAAAVKPAGKPSPAAKSVANAARPAASPPAVVATSVAGLPAVGATPAVRAEARAAAPADALGVAALAGSAAATADPEAAALCGPGAVLSTRAGQMAGKPATVAIARVAASYQPAVRGQPTFLNDAPHPNHVFTAVIWGDDRGQFRPAPEGWQGKGLCVTGPVELYQQRPQIVVVSPSQIRAAR